jgi:hypothetical protein
VLRGDKTVFHCVGEFYTRGDPDDAGGTLHGMCSSHAGLELIRSGRITLQHQQAMGQYLTLALRLHLEKP